VVAGGQTPVNLHIAIDPTNANIVYLTGDAHETCGNSPPTSVCSVQAFRLNYNPNNNTSTATSLTSQGTFANNFLDANTVHADSRAIAFDFAGNLILSSDGGIYLRNNPQGNGTWQGLNNNLSVFEPYVVAYDANSKRLAVAAQDNGVSLQSAPGSSLFNAINLGDGTNVAINDRTLSGLSAIYNSFYNLGQLSRMIVNAQGQVVSPFPDPVNNPGGVPVTCNGGQDCSTVTHAGGNFSAPFVLNKIDPSLIAIGGTTDVFVGRDSLSGSNGVNATSVDLSLTNLGTTPGPTIIAYGTVNDTRAIAVGADTGGVNTGGPRSGLVQHHQRRRIARAIDELRGQYPNRPCLRHAHSVSYFCRRRVGRLLHAERRRSRDVYDPDLEPAGGLYQADIARVHLQQRRQRAARRRTQYAADLHVGAQRLPDLEHPKPHHRRRQRCERQSVGLVYQMVYNPTVDVLSVASIGRGAWLPYDVTSNFSQATVLQFGLANYNSNPDPSLLTDGTVGSRPLIKYGTGTLTITGNATYSGSTTVNGGVLEVHGTISNTSSVAVNSGAMLTGMGTVDPVTVTINSGAAFATGAAGVPGTSMTIAGNLAFQSGALYVVQLNSTTSTFANVTGTASLNGNVLAAFVPGTILQRQYTILTSAGLGGTTFGGVVIANLPNFAASLSYT
jgi:autotransporter-associated beta strand protein